MCGLFILKYQPVPTFANLIVFVDYGTVRKRRVLSGMDSCSIMNVPEKVDPRTDIQDPSKKFRTTISICTISIHYSKWWLMCNQYVYF